MGGDRGKTEIKDTYIYNVVTSVWDGGRGEKGGEGGWETEIKDTYIYNVIIE